MVRQGPKTVLGSFGELHPRVLAALDLTGPVVAFELNLDAVPDPKRRRKAAPELPPFQPVRRDFAFLVDAGVSADAVLRAARGAERTLIAGVSLFDVYDGDKLPEGKKSLAIEVVFQPRERTLTDAEIEAACQKVVAARGEGDRGDRCDSVTRRAPPGKLSLRASSFRASCLFECSEAIAPRVRTSLAGQCFAALAMTVRFACQLS